MADIRREYSLGGLNRADLDANPLAQFNQWFAQAASGSRWRKIGIALYKLWHAVLGHAPIDVNAMVLATVDKAGRPSTRAVLLKGVDERGFIFFTNYDSRKGRELAENPNAALTFYWPDLERQVCVAGTVEQIVARRIGGVFQKPSARQPPAAWASNQSGVVADRAALEKSGTRWRHDFPATCRCRRTGAVTC